MGAMSYIKISVKTLSGEIIPLTVMQEGLLDQVKYDLQVLKGFPVTRQRLMLAGKQMESGRTLSDYNIQDGAVVHLVLRLEDE